MAQQQNPNQNQNQSNQKNQSNPVQNPNWKDKSKDQDYLKKGAASSEESDVGSEEENEIDAPIGSRGESGDTLESEDSETKDFGSTNSRESTDSKMKNRVEIGKDIDEKDVKGNQFGRPDTQLKNQKGSMGSVEKNQ